MNEQEILLVLIAAGAVITDSHVVYTSGKHGSVYINKDALYPHTGMTKRLCYRIAERFIEDNVETVIAPAIGGVILSQWVAYHLSEMIGRKVFSVYAEKEGTELISSSYGPLPLKYEDKFVIRRGYDKFITGKNVLVVEDVLTTGGSAKKVIEATRAIGGKVIGLGVLVNRGGIMPQDVANPPKLLALVNIRLDAWEEIDCPLCAQGVPINTEVGNGKEYLSFRKEAEAVRKDRKSDLRNFS